MFRNEAEANVLAWCRFAAADVFAALRDPPAHVIEAGAKAIYEAAIMLDAWHVIDQSERNMWMFDWLASWRAALNAEVHPSAPETPADPASTPA